MKKLYIIAAAALTLGATSCDDTLDKQPLDEIVSNTQYWSNPDNVQTQIDRFYNDYAGYGNNGGQGSFYFNALSDDQTDNAFANWDFTNIPASASAWKSPWSEIRGMNEVIVNIRKAHPTNETFFEGVARMNRAYQYYQLVRDFGDVQWVNEPIDPADKDKVYAARDDRDVVMDSVLNDLNYAIATIGEGANKHVWSSDLAAAMKSEICLYEGTFCRYRNAADNGKAADDSRAKKYLEEAVKAAQIVMNGVYSLTEHYGEIYNSLDLSGNSEIIFYKPYSQPNGSFGHGTVAYISSSTAHKGITKDAFNAFLFKDGKPLALTSKDKSDKAKLVDGKLHIEDLLAVRDGRLATIIEPVLGLNGYELQRDEEAQLMTSSTGYCIRKFNTEKLTKYQRETIGQNITSAPLFWLAKVYCEFAEAKAELGTLTDADLNASINKLQTRAGLPNLSVAAIAHDPANNMGVSDLLWEVRRVRRCELMLDGFRFYDLVRWHQLDKLDTQAHPDIFLGANVGDVTGNFTVVNGYVRSTPDKERVYANKYYLYPIPSGQLVLNPKLTQNPLWTK